MPLDLWNKYRVCRLMGMPPAPTWEDATIHECDWFLAFERLEIELAKPDKPKGK